jgi:alkanesulfonate monooxygenase SsuD/methylene tetrahydromethanopterin reductase-like flavin-dependent oxidoreductase (luciferase family)
MDAQTATGEVQPPKIGFFFWPTSPDRVVRMGQLAEEHGYDLVGVADTPGLAMDCWVAATLLSEAAPSVPLSICVSNFVSRHWTTSGAAAALAMTHKPGFIFGVGAGHSSMRNFGLQGSTADELDHDLSAIMRLVRGEAVPNGVGTAELTWTQKRPKVFLAASHERSLRLAGAAADGVFVNYGLRPENIAETTRHVMSGTGPARQDTEVWQVAAMDCAEDGAIARAAIGKMCAFIAGYVIGKRDPAKRGVPTELVEPMRELVRSYSTRPSQTDSNLVARLGLTDYLSQRVAVCGDPDECLDQVRAAARAGARALMFSVGQGSDPVRVVDTFGRYVLPALRAEQVPQAHV